MGNYCINKIHHMCHIVRENHLRRHLKMIKRHCEIDISLNVKLKFFEIGIPNSTNRDFWEPRKCIQFTDSCVRIFSGKRAITIKRIHRVYYD